MSTDPVQSVVVRARERLPEAPSQSGQGAETVLNVAGLAINVVRKDIKNLHLGVYPPTGRVRVAAPLVISDEAVRLAVIDKLAWIKLQRSKFEQQPRQSEREMAVGESHYVFGRRYRLRVHEAEGSPRVAMRGIASLDLFVGPGASQAQRAAMLDRWYREQLKAMVTPMFAVWQAKLGVQAHSWGIKRMKTKWGSCTPGSRRVWLNSELAKKPVECIEYIVVHELLHLAEPTHGERFVALMNRHLPRWAAMQKRLNAAPLGHEDWRF